MANLYIGVDRMFNMRGSSVHCSKYSSTFQGLNSLNLFFAKNDEDALALFRSYFSMGQDQGVGGGYLLYFSSRLAMLGICS